jgi:hypothetical protein
MLNRYFVRPATVDRIRASWIGGPIEQYVTWLTDKGYAARNVFHRVPVLVHYRRVRPGTRRNTHRGSCRSRRRLCGALDRATRHPMLHD